jgi:VanZ family protein
MGTARSCQPDVAESAQLSKSTRQAPEFGVHARRRFWYGWMMHSKALPPFFPNSKFSRPALWIVFALWAALLFFASTRPGQPGPEAPIFGFDKFLHFTFFFCGALSLGAAIRSSFAIRWSTLFLVVLVVLCSLGLADEINQLFVTNRSGGDPFDWMADLTGSAVGLVALRKFYAKRSPAP